MSKTGHEPAFPRPTGLGMDWQDNNGYTPISCEGGFTKLEFLTAQCLSGVIAANLYPIHGDEQISLQIKRAKSIAKDLLFEFEKEN